MVEDEPHYIIYDIVKNDNKYRVEFIDYVLDISETLKDIENASKFSSGILEIEENEGKLHIVACKNK